MDDRRSSDRGPRNDRNKQDHGDHQPIDYWENIRAVLERERDVGRKHMTLRINMQRPVFMDGRMGYYRLNTFLRIDGNYLQLSTSALAALANYFYYNRERIVSAIDDVRNRNAKIDQILGEQEDGSNGGHDDTDRFVGLENEPREEDEENDSENEEGDYEEVVIVNEEGPKGETGNTNSDTGPRRTRRAREN